MTNVKAGPDRGKKLQVSEIHRPSAFEGALWTVLGIKDAQTIFHSPIIFLMEIYYMEQEEP
jgi:hypothetical protein